MCASVIKSFRLQLFRIPMHVCIAVMHEFLHRGNLSCEIVGTVSPKTPEMSSRRQQVADLEMKLHQNDYIDIQLKMLVSSLRTLPPCSYVPTSWTRKTFLASRTPSWFSIGVMRTERESEH